MKYYYMKDPKRAGEVLRAYIYHASDSSFLGNRLQFWWNFCLGFLPGELSPNVLTSLSFIVVSLGSIPIISSGYNFHQFDNDPPMFIFWFTALVVFVYQTLDAVDGKLARKFGTYSAIGEFFDHGGDAVIESFILVFTMIVFQLGESFYPFLLMSAVMFTGIMMTLEEYVTMNLRFSQYNSVTELLVALISTLLVAPFYNFSLISFSFLGFTMTVTEVFVLLMVGILFPINIYDVTVHVYDYVQKGSDQLRARGIEFRDFLVSFVPVIISYLVFWSWFFLDMDFLTSNILLLCFIIGTFLSYLQSRMIVKRLIYEKPQKFYLILVPLVVLYGCYLFVLFTDNDEGKKKWILIAFLINNTAFILHLFSNFILEARNLLGIDLFSVGKIKKLNKERTKANRNNQ